VGFVSSQSPTPARQLWQLAEPYHALTYFAPEAHQAYEDAGLRGFWRGYFAGRAAPLGPVGPGAVTATFYGFHPAFVARALPSIWSVVTPEEAVRARLRGIDGAARRIFVDRSDDPGFAEAVELLRTALEGCSSAGRALFAANLDLGWPTEPHVALWHAATLVREHRGDGHVAALAVGGLDPCEAHVTQVAASGSTRDTIQPYRGWADDDWDAAVERLRARGWLDDAGGLTQDGAAGRARIEDDTDRLAGEVTDRLDHDALDRLLDVLEPIAGRIIERGVMPYPNPIGVPRPRT